MFQSYKKKINTTGSTTRRITGRITENTTGRTTRSITETIKENIIKIWNKGKRSDNATRYDIYKQEKRSDNAIDYDNCQWEKTALVSCYIRKLAIVCMVSYSFYQSIILTLVALPIAHLLVKREKKGQVKKRREKLANHFREGIQFIASNLRAGYSVENALREARYQMVDLYGPEDDLVLEFESMSRRLDMNQPLSSLLEDFAARSHVEDIELFAENFAVAKRSGGDLNEIIAYTARTISEKSQVLMDIEGMVAAKRMEQRLMSVMPMAIILFVNVSSPGFLEPMYHNAVGIVIMTVCLGLYLLALYLADKILGIEI